METDSSQIGPAGYSLPTLGLEDRSFRKEKTKLVVFGTGGRSTVEITWALSFSSAVNTWGPLTARGRGTFGLRSPLLASQAGHSELGQATDGGDKGAHRHGSQRWNRP